MKKIKFIAIAGALSSTLLVVGCGGSSGKGSSENPQTDSRVISGAASAPGSADSGAVANFSQQSPLELAVNFFITPLAAEITGLKPIKGADVELIRVDNNGDQVGDVLATTTTSITGDYKLTLPENVNLAGNLVVRITGQNSKTLRAQVVERNVDISPVSEFVLRKFVDQGAALDQLVVTDVVKLSGRVEEFDISLSDSADLSAAFAVLENEIGNFVENEVAVAASEKGNAANIVGNYRSSAFSLDLHDSDNDTYGTFANDLWAGSFTFADSGNGAVTVTLNSEDSFYSSLHGNALNQGSVYYEFDIDKESESFPATLTSSGILSISGPFEEEIDEDSGWRYPANTYNFQRVANSGLFFMVSNEATVRYATVDTNSDGTKDAIDPAAKQGDEVFRTLELFSREPTAFTNADLNGTFGRVHLESWLAGSTIELQTETNTLTFDGAGNYDYGAVEGHLIGVGSTGATYNAVTEGAGTNLPIVITANGDITSVAGEESDGFINDQYNFIAFNEASGRNQSTANAEAEGSKTLMVKLPTSQLNVSGNKYRMLLTSMKLESSPANDVNFLVSSSKFNTFLTMASNTEGKLNGAFFEARKDGLGGDIRVNTDSVEDHPISVSVDSTGATTLSASSGDGGTTTMEGFFNEDATLGIFTLSYKESASANPDELGLVVLVKTDS